MDTFGNTHRGDLVTWADKNRLRAFKHTCPSDGVGISITMYSTQTSLGNNPRMKFALYDDNGGVPGNLVAYTEEWQLTDGWDGWKTLKFVNPPSLIGDKDYHITFWLDADLTVYWDTGVPEQYHRGYATYDGFPATFPAIEKFGTDSDPIYCTYTPTAPPPTKYILTVGTIGQGTTDPAPGSWEYSEGTEALVNAIPAAGWAFDYWEGDISTVDNPVKVLMTRDLNITAVFLEVIVPPGEHAVTISVIGEGTTEPASGAYTIIHGATLTITAHPAAGWNFSHWEGDISGTATPADIEVLGDISVVAVFVKVPAPPPSKPAWVWPLAVAGGISAIGIIIAIARGRRKK